MRGQKHNARWVVNPTGSSVASEVFADLALEAGVHACEITRSALKDSA